MIFLIIFLSKITFFKSVFWVKMTHFVKSKNAEEQSILLFLNENPNAGCVLHFTPGFACIALKFNGRRL